MFSGCTVPPDSKEVELGTSDQEAFPSAGKIARIVLVPCRMSRSFQERPVIARAHAHSRAKVFRRVINHMRK